MLSRHILLSYRRPAAGSRCYKPIRRYNNSQAGHTTYFQPTNRPRLRWRILRGSLIALISAGAGAYSMGAVFASAITPSMLEQLSSQVEDDRKLAEEMQLLEFASRALHGDIGEMVLEMGTGAFSTPGVITHHCRLAANLPCEDQEAHLFFSVPDRTWCLWGIFDGHAGPRTSNLLASMLLRVLVEELNLGGYLDAPHVPNDGVLIRTIQNAFDKLDKELLDREHLFGSYPSLEWSRARSVADISLADQGSCALVALYDQKHSILRVANAGDSRAVLGRWDAAQGKYIAVPLSSDHTGFNEDEIKRLNAEHPGEEVITNGRLFGLAVTRAFGDSRWKFPEEVTTWLHKNFWANPPRPNGVIKTPPYVTAEPEVKEIKIQLGPKPDFLVMASDGLWDQLSSEQGVDLIEMWLEQKVPEHYIKSAIQDKIDRENGKEIVGSLQPPPELHVDADSDDADMWYDPEEKSLRWLNKTEHFIVKDDSAAAHLVRNALGGKRSGLFNAIMAVPPTRARDVRDDITTSVIFFGADTSECPMPTRSLEMI